MGYSYPPPVVYVLLGIAAIAVAVLLHLRRKRKLYRHIPLPVVAAVLKSRHPDPAQISDAIVATRSYLETAKLQGDVDPYVLDAYLQMTKLAADYFAIRGDYTGSVLCLRQVWTPQPSVGGDASAPKKKWGLPILVNTDRWEALADIEEFTGRTCKARLRRFAIRLFTTPIPNQPCR